LQPLSNLIDHNQFVPQRSRRPGDAPAVAADAAAGRLELPLAWDSVDPPSAEMLDAAELTNVGVLSFLLQEIDSEARTRPVEEAIAEAIAPLRVKLDMVIAMLAQLSYRDVELPPRRPLELVPGQLGWLAPQPSDPGDWLRLRLYFHPLFRDPVVLYGKVASCRAEGAGEYAIEADLAGVAEHVGNDLARLAYLAHRRQLAQRAGERRAR
jgi:hypothetical protein